ncbi:hypothetical protein GCM10007862_09830 [Dyella lipolytica]|uniref:Uncharacterized protein n=1 Tax=Dyella lipolytica TaxID=1867835 RepID=A0ABW8IXN8_9GAMM|nr:hypothetical protein [Dyella lipolytica]GLQ45932.1 hypothetical protein GCM10007862_09830 [Dyella lipolytica]
MKSILIKTIAALAIFGAAQSAFAARPYAEVVTFLNSSGTVIGGDVVYCNNVAYHMGTTSSSYYVVALESCSGSAYQSPVYPGSGVENYVLPGDETIQEGCVTVGVQCLIDVQPQINNINGMIWQPGWVNPVF